MHEIKSSFIPEKKPLLQHLYIFSVMIPIYPHETKRSILLFKQSIECWFFASTIDVTTMYLRSVMQKDNFLTVGR